MRWLTLPIALLAALLAGCPGGAGQRQSIPAAPAIPDNPLHIALLRSDLGLQDGQMVAHADTTLAELADQGLIQYTPVGIAPTPLQQEASQNDIGLPGSKSDNPAVPPAGAMTLQQAAALVADLPAADLVVATPALLDALAEPIAAGQTVLLLDRAPLDAEVADNVLQLGYDVRYAAFLLGLAAGTSSNTQLVGALADATDPDADDFFDGLNAGLRFRMNGAWLLGEKVETGSDGVVTPESFAAARNRIITASSSYQPNHYIVGCGRAAPSLMYALSLPPSSAKVLGAWGDFRQVRPARVIACAVKDPRPALRRLLHGTGSLDELMAQFEDSVALSTFEEGGTYLTDFSVLNQFAVEAEDIAEAVQAAEAEIRAGELDVLELIEHYRR